MNNNSWNTISETLGIPKHEIMFRWYALRGNYQVRKNLFSPMLHLLIKQIISPHIDSFKKKTTKRKAGRLLSNPSD